jgi:threonine aldolase
MQIRGRSGSILDAIQHQRGLKRGHGVEKWLESSILLDKMAEGLADITGFEVDPSVDTNMVFFSPPEGQMAALQAHLKARDILISGARLVTHLDISARDIETAIDAFAAF